MTASTFWIGLPDGWHRTAFDPEYQRRVRATLSDTAAAIPELAQKCNGLRTLLDDAASEATTDILFAAHYYASPAPGHVIQSVLTISTLCDTDLRSISNDADTDSYYDPQVSSVDHESNRSNDQPTRRRTIFEPGPTELGIEATATAQYFLDTPRKRDVVVVSFSTTSVAYWAELLCQFDAIVATVAFPDAPEL